MNVIHCLKGLTGCLTLLCVGCRDCSRRQRANGPYRFRKRRFVPRSDRPKPRPKQQLLDQHEDGRLLSESGRRQQLTNDD